MFKKINETLFKVILIFLLSLALVVLAVTAWQFYNDGYTQETLTWHMYMGLFVLFLTPIHMITKKKKIKKLIQEFLNILKREDIKHVNNKERLLDTLKIKTLKEIADLLNLDMESIILALKKEHVEVDSSNQTLKNIAKENSKDMYQIFILILYLHVEGSSPKKG